MSRKRRGQSETSLTNAILTAHGARPDLRIWRNETSGVWVGKPAGYTAQGDLILRGARQIQAGLCKGSADLIGLHAHVVTADDVGSTFGQFVAAEVKRPEARGPTVEQSSFLETVKRMGGIAGVVRSAQDLEHLLNGRHNE